MPTGKAGEGRGRGLNGCLGYGNTENVGDTPGTLPFTVGDVPLL